MKKISIFLCVLPFLFNCTSKKDGTKTATVLQGATLFTGDGDKIENGILVIEEGMISAIGDENTILPENAKTIDVTGKFITPGLVDAHVHFSQTGFFDGRPDVVNLTDTLPVTNVQERQKNNPERFYEAYLRSGVTAVYDVGGFSWTMSFQQTAENNLNAPHVAASGPLITPVPKERIAILNSPSDSVLVHLSSAQLGRKVVRSNDSLGATGIKIWSLALADSAFINNLQEIKDEIDLRGNKLIVHATNLDEAKHALRLGTKVLVHSVDDQVVDDEFIELIKAADAIYCPTLIVGRGYYNCFKSLRDGYTLNDPNRVIDEGTKKLLSQSTTFLKYFGKKDEIDSFLERIDGSISSAEKVMFENLKILHEAGVTIALSTDAGNPGTLHGLSIYDELEAMQKAGIPPAALIPMATRNGAMAMDRADDFGTLAQGKMADLIVLDKDPSLDITNMRSITHVMRGGLIRPVNQPFE